MSNKPQTTEQPSSFPENWIPKVGDVLIAISPCIMSDTDEAALVVGKEYPVLRVEGRYFSVDTMAGKDHLFDFSGSSAWWNFFKLKPAEPAKRYFIVSYSTQAINGRLIIGSTNFVGSFPSKFETEKTIQKANRYNYPVQILSISELSETDYKQFYGEE